MTDEKQFGLNRPEATAKDEYLFLWQNAEINLAHIIATSEVKFDPRIPRMVRYMISLIANDKTRKKAEQRFDETVTKANSRKDLSLDERNEDIFKISMTMNGELTSYVDQFKGLSHQLKIGELVDLKKTYFKAAYYKDNYEVTAEDMKETVSFTKTDIVFNDEGLFPPEPDLPVVIETEHEPTSVYTLKRDMGEDNDGE